MLTTNYSILIRKLAILLALTPLYFYTTFHTILLLYIVFGQAHFMITYHYLIKKKKFSKLITLLYFITLTTLLSLSYFFEFYDLLVVITITHFMLHTLFDDIYHFKKSISWEHFFLVLPSITFFLHNSLKSKFEIDLIELFFFSLIIPFVISVFRLLKNKKDQNNIVIYFSILTLVFFSLMISNYEFEYFKIIGIVILYHYISWYIEYFLSCKKESLKPYFKRIILYNSLSISLFGLYYYQYINYFEYLFEPEYFYIWTLMHTLFSTRIKDFSFLKS